MPDSWGADNDEPPNRSKDWSYLSLSKSTDETPQRNGARPYPRALPQWMLNAARPVVTVFCRLMWRMEWRHTEYIPLTGGLLIAATHQTYVDPFWVCGRAPRQ